MATLKSSLKMIGTLDNLSFYRVAGSKEIFVRAKGGPSSKRVKTDPGFARTRENASEFAARAIAGNMIREGLKGGLTEIIDYRLVQSLHAPLRTLQVLDLRRPGERGISLSENAVIVEGLSLNKSCNLESLIRTPISCEIREDGTATVHIPKLAPGINLRLKSRHQFFRICAVLASVPDIHRVGEQWIPMVPNHRSGSKKVYDHTPWIHASTTTEPYTFHLEQKIKPDSDRFIWMLSVGVQIGRMVTPTEIVPIPRKGAAKVMRALSGRKMEGEPGEDVQPSPEVV